ncbi:MAG: hypothetical protein LBS74_03655 [Oscillospiraceae bacterium]|jgi:hypothetical protein|nr:hypothetical protein [Oscillospiraceae bacterium]
MKKHITLVIALLMLFGLCACVSNGNSISSSSVDAAEESPIVSDNSPNTDKIGKAVNIKVYVNEIEVDTPVYTNKESPPVSGPDNVSDYVLLRSVCKALGADIEVTDAAVIIKYKGESYKILKDEVSIIEDEIYVPFSSIRYSMNGSLKQETEEEMYLYTADFERLDIPATLEECYKALDKELKEEDKLKIKNSSVDDLGDYHFGLGMWIRNNWIYPTSNRIARVFLDAGINQPDTMSSMIIEGYHFYLNGLPYEIPKAQ